MEAATVAEPNTAAEEEAQRLLQERLAQEANGQDPDDPQPQEQQSQLDDIEAELPHREWQFKGTYMVVIGNEGVQQEFDEKFVQKPLSYHAMMEFTGLLGRKLDQVMSGPEGLSLDQIRGHGADAFNLPIGFQDGNLVLAPGDMGGGVDGFVRAMAKLVGVVPDILLEAQCIWLRVPKAKRPILMDIWARPIDEGGMSHDEGDDMMTLFIDQNYPELERFFVERAPKWGRTAAKARKRMLAQRGV